MIFLNLSTITDLFIVALYFAVIIFIGLKVGKKEKTFKGFALANHQIPWWAVLASIIAAETSAGSFLGTPGEGYALQNYFYLQIAIGSLLGRIIASYVFIDQYFKHDVTSIYELLETRFGPRTRSMASAVFIFTRTLASGARLYISAILLAVLARTLIGRTLAPSEEVSIYAIAVLIMTVLTAIYTSIGGIKAVIWTDFIQTLVMICGSLAALAILMFHVNGSSHFISNAPLWNFGSFSHFFNQNYTLFAGLFGSTFITLATHGTDQDMVQRMLSAENSKRARLSIALSGFVELPIIFIFLTIGILLKAYYTQFPHAGIPEKSNEIFSYFMIHELPVGVRGLVIAGVFATAMGSLSTALNALATSFTKDWWLKHKSKRTSDQATLREVKIATVLFAFLLAIVGVLTAVLVVMVPNSRIIPIALGVFGYTYGSLLGIFLLAVLTKKRGSEMGNVIAMFSGMIAVLLTSEFPLWHQPEWLPHFGFTWRVLLGTLITFAVAFCFKKPSKS